MAEVNVNDGEIITGSQVLAGDTLNVSNGGLAENTVVSGGTAVIAAGGSANVMDVYGDSVSGVSGTVDLAGNATSVTLNSGGWLNVNNGGVATSAKIFSGTAVVISYQQNRACPKHRGGGQGRWLRKRISNQAFRVIQHPL